MVARAHKQGLYLVALGNGDGVVVTNRYNATSQLTLEDRRLYTSIQDTLNNLLNSKESLQLFTIVQGNPSLSLHNGNSR